MRVGACTASAINLGTTVPKWNQGKKPNRLNISFFCLLGKNHVHTTLNKLHEKKKTKTKCA